MRRLHSGEVATKPEAQYHSEAIMRQVYLLIGTEIKAGALQSAIFASANFSRRNWRRSCL
jgi:hypothetical protein